jgi:hypothetical protein
MRIGGYDLFIVFGGIMPLNLILNLRFQKIMEFLAVFLMY